MWEAGSGAGTPDTRRAPPRSGSPVSRPLLVHRRIYMYVAPSPGAPGSPSEYFSALVARPSSFIYLIYSCTRAGAAHGLPTPSFNFPSHEEAALF